MDTNTRKSLFDRTRLRQRDVARLKRGSMKWKYYILHRDIEGFYEQLHMYFSGCYKTINSRISFCTTVMDRFEHIEKTFIKNILDNDSFPDCEFVLLNYNCPDPRTDEWACNKLMPYIKSGKVNYYKYSDESKSFHASHARNVAFRLAKNNIVCNVDADNYLGRNFVAYVSAMLQQENIYLRGPVDRRGVAGRICCYKRDWEAVGGYDERFLNWGVEDSDLDSRLNLIGLERKTIFPEKFCKCIQHSNELRSKHYQEDVKSSYKKNWALRGENIARKTINPNGDNYGRGRVLKNCKEWIEL